MDFKKISDREWESDIFNYSDEKISFNYKWNITSFTYQPEWGSTYKTKYTVMFIVDKSSRHDSHNEGVSKTMEKILYGFPTFEKEFKTDCVNENDLALVISKISDKKIKTKIKGKYKKIQSFVNGDNFYL